MRSNALRCLAGMAAMMLSGNVHAQLVAETVQVRVVEVPVTVSDGDGKPLRGLTKEQFQLFDEGKRVPVEYFEVLDMKILDLRDGKPLPPAATRNFLLFFDLANSRPATIQRGADAATSFVDGQLGQHDLAAVATFTAEAGARMITSFTSDKAMLRAAIRTLGNPHYFIVGDPLMLSWKEKSPHPEPAEAREEGRRRGGAMIDELLAESEVERNRMTRKAENSEQRNRLRVQLSEMATIARVLDRLHGRKQIILLSEGFDARLVQGREEIGFEKARAENDAVLSGEVWNVDSDQRYGSASAARDVGEMAEIFRRSDVTLHAIDIKGLRAGNAEATAFSENARGRSNEALFLLTTPTGGTVFKNENDLEDTFTRMLRQQEVTYLLGFNARSAGRPGKFRSLKVKIGVPGARVSHRAGYFEASNRMTNLEKTISLTEILMTDRPINEVGLSLSLTALPGPPGGKGRVPVVVELPGAAFLEGIEGEHVTANLFVYAFRGNQVVDSLTQRIAADLFEAGERLRRTGIRYFGTLQLPPGDYAIKAVVRVEESGKVAFARSAVSVPELGKAAVLRPVFIADPAEWVMLAGSPRGDTYPYPFAAGDRTYVPRASPMLASGKAQRLALFLYRVPVESLVVTSALTAADGTSQPAQVKLVGRTAEDDAGIMKLLFDFTPEGLPSGQYELRLTVKPKEGAESVVSLPFQVL